VRYLVFFLFFSLVNGWVISSEAGPCIIKKGSLRIFDPQFSQIAFNGKGGLSLFLLNHQGGVAETHDISCEVTECQNRAQKIIGLLGKIHNKGFAAFFDTASISEWNINRAGEQLVIFAGCQDEYLPYPYSPYSQYPSNWSVNR